MARGEVPASILDLKAGRTEPMRAKSNGAALHNGDMLEIRVGGGGGYGDPLERNAELVARDVELGYVSSAAAQSIYGVKLTPAGKVDTAATADLRKTLLAERASWRPGIAAQDVASKSATGEPPRSVHETIVTADHDGERVLACARCGHRYCGHGGNYKAAALLDEAPVTTIPSAADPAFFVDENWVLRRYCCPGCHVQVCAEVAQSDGPIEPEMALA